MRVGIFIFLFAILLISNVYAVQNPALYIGENKVTKVPVSNNPITRNVELIFAVEEPFTRLTVDASDLALSGTIKNSQDNLLVSECDDSGPVIICNVENVKLQTNKRNVNLAFSINRGGVIVEETASLNFDVDDKAPSVGSIIVNECENNCFFGTGDNSIELEISDESGISPEYVPLLVGGDIKRPFDCDESSCYYDLSAITCVDGSTITVVVPSSVSDDLGNKIPSQISQDFICDPASPILLEGPRIVDRGPLDHLYEGVEIQIKARIEDSTPVKMFVDTRHMDGSLSQPIICTPVYQKEQLCEGKIFSPPGPQKGNAKVLFVDEAGNELDANLELEIFELNTDAVPSLEIDHVEHSGGVSRMLLAVAGERNNYNINYPLLFELSPRLRVEGSNLRASIAHTEVTDCKGGVVEDFTLASSTSRENRLDVKLNSNFLQSGNPASINCTVKTWVKNGDKFFENPGVANLYVDLELSGTDFGTPGERVIELIEERDSMNEAFAIVEGLNNLVPTLNTMCNINNAINKGEIVGAGIQVVGFAAGPVGEPIKKAGQKISDKLLQVSGVLGSYYNDKRIKERIENNPETSDALEESEEIVNQGAAASRNPVKTLEKNKGFLTKACEYITCSNANTGRETIGSADSLKGVFNGALDDIKMPNARDNFYYAYEQKCVPAMIANLNDYGQAYCGGTYCIKNMAYNGGDLSSCTQIESEAICKKVVGSVVDIGAYLASNEEGDLGTVGDVALTLKNFNERATTVFINTAIGAANLVVIEGVTGNCQKVEKDAISDHKSLNCFIPRAIRLFIESSAQSQYFNEMNSGVSNLCELATCEGNECRDKLLSKEQANHWNVLINDVDYDEEFADLDPNKINNNLVVVKKNDDESADNIEFEGQTLYVEKEYWNSLSEQQRKDYAKAAENWDGTFDFKEMLKKDPEEIQKQAEILKAVFNSENSLATADPNVQGPEVPKSKFTTLPEGVSPNVAPLTSVDPNMFSKDFDSDRSNYYTDQEGNIVAWDPSNKEWKKVYSPNNPGLAYDLYREAASPFVNQLFEDKVISHVRDDVQSAVDYLDVYTAFENKVCEISLGLPPLDTRAVFEPTSTGYVQFDFNAERHYSELDNTYYYTLVFFASGFNQEGDGVDEEGNPVDDEGYEVSIYLNDPERLSLRTFKIYENEVFRPDSSNPEFKSIRAFNISREYRELCFKFSPAIPGKTDTFCKELRDDAWAGLGDPYVPGSNINSGRQSLGGGEEWLV